MEKYSFSWTTDYVAEYDKSVDGAGSSSYDNQALFNFNGKPLKSLKVFRRALIVEENSAANGANVSLQPYWGDASQNFILHHNSDDLYAFLTAPSSNKSCLDVYNISMDNDANICRWKYWGGNCQKFIIEPVAEPQKIAGDINNDEEFNTADVVIMQKWLLAIPNTTLAEWKAGDLCEDNNLNIFDLCLMKRMLIEQ